MLRNPIFRVFSGGWGLYPLPLSGPVHRYHQCFFLFVFRTCKNEGKCVMASATSYTCKCYEGYGSVDCEKPSGKTSIGTASANSVEFRGIRPWMYIEDLL